MAQEPAAPWSRWDAPGYQFIASYTYPPVRQYDFGSVGQYQEGAGVLGTGVQSQPTGGILQPPYITGTLIDSRPNLDNPGFLDCIYATPNGLGRVVEQCLADIGCCATTCCDNTSWNTKYRWAVALICIFSALVLIALLAWLLTYLYNRQKDKRQNKLLTGSTRGMSPAPSQASVSDPYAGRVDQGYYPYVGGPKRTY